jgi:hypothetical protein
VPPAVYVVMPSNIVADRRRSHKRRQEKAYQDAQREVRRKRQDLRRQHTPGDCSFLLCNTILSDEACSVQNHDPTLWWEHFSAAMRRSRWSPPTWRRTCQWCNCLLLTGELKGFCCNNKKWLLPALPPLPANLSLLLHDPQHSRGMSTASRRFNNLFCFTAIGATEGFTHFASGTASVSIGTVRVAALAALQVMIQNRFRFSISALEAWEM